MGWGGFESQTPPIVGHINEQKFLEEIGGMGGTGYKSLAKIAKF